FEECDGPAAVGQCAQQTAERGRVAVAPRRRDAEAEDVELSTHRRVTPASASCIHSSLSFARQLECPAVVYQLQRPATQALQAWLRQAAVPPPPLPFGGESWLP